MTRRIKALQWAHLTSDAPPFTKSSRPTAAMKAGKRFEKRLATLITELATPAGWRVYWGQWIAFHDVNGFGMAQPDLILRKGLNLILLEAKLTQTSAAWPQMEDLYIPLLHFVFPGATVGGRVQAIHRIKTLDPSAPLVALPDLLTLQKSERRTLHLPLL